MKYIFLNRYKKMNLLQRYINRKYDVPSLVNLPLT